MSTIKTTYIQHPSATNPNIELAADGTVVLPLSDLEDLNNVSATPTDGQALVWDAGTSQWVAETVTPSSLDASVITTGTFDAARIPNLDAAKITSGRFSDARMALGSTLQVVQAAKTDLFTTTSTSFTDVTGLTVNITPSSASSKILIIATIASSHAVTTSVSQFILTRGTTSIFQSTGAVARNQSVVYLDLPSTKSVGYATVVYLDSPSTTSSTNYRIRTRTVGGVVAVNRRADNADDGAVSSITAIEVAA